jgi:hypothetical protein
MVGLRQDMLLAVHAAVGAIAGDSVNHASVAFVLGLVSHFFLDMIPHGDIELYNGYKGGGKVKRAVIFVAADALATVAVIAFIVIKQDFASPLCVSLGVLGGLLPDLMVGLSQVLKPKVQKGLVWRLKRFEKFHIENHHYLTRKLSLGDFDFKFRYGIVMQVALLTWLVKMIV